MIALCDCNAFYASAEMVFRPDWRLSRGLIVLSNNDGCVVACNRKAKELGIEKFQPYFQVKALCEQKGIIVCSSNYSLYFDLSDKMMQTIERFSSNSYRYSIDEIFLSLEPAEVSDFYQYGVDIRKTVWRNCRLPISIGFGDNLTLAKIANRYAKDHRETMGVYVIDSEPKRIHALKQTHISDVWGIGRRLTKQLSYMGVSTAWDLASQSISNIQRNFNVEVVRVHQELNGKKAKSWDNQVPRQKQIFSTRAFGAPVTDLTSLQQALSQHAHIASAKARKQKLLCKVVHCFAATSAFSQSPRTFRSTYELSYPTSDTNKISAIVNRLAHELFKEGHRYSKSGVGLVELVDGESEQIDMFNDSPNNKELMNVFDNINTRYGRDTIFLGAQGTSQKWKMRRDFLTPSYTTNWRDLPKLKC